MDDLVLQVARRLATWEVRGWNVHSLDIENGWATWFSRQRTEYTARLRPGENYILIPLHCRELSEQWLRDQVVVESRHLQAARWRIQDMQEYVRE